MSVVEPQTIRKEDSLRDFWPALTEVLFDFDEKVHELPIIPDVTAAEIREHLAKEFPFDRPEDDSVVVRKAAVVLERWGLHTPHPRYFGLYNPDVFPITVAADAMVAAFNPQLAAWSHAPAANEMEAHALAFFQRLMGHDRQTSSASFTSGGMEANHSAVIVALTHQFPALGEEGIRALEGQPVMYVSEEAHHSFLKAAHATGIGRNFIRSVPTENLKMDPETLGLMIAEDRKHGLLPFLVVGTAGTTPSGTVDPLHELADLCNRERLFFHVDAAWGGAALLSRKLKGELDGIERADSVTFDAHKWLSVPMGAGMFFCKHRESVFRSFGAHTSYMPARSETPDPYTSTLQWSRRATGIKVFMALASLGAEGYESVIDHQADMADYFRELLAERGWNVVNDTKLPVVCFTHDRLASPKDLIAKLYELRTFWISPVTLGDGQECLRCCITNYRTEKTDLEALLNGLEKLL